MKGITVALVGLISLVYLVYPSLGWFELIPDATPIIGSLDEASATALLLASLRYFGLDVANLFKKEPPKSKYPEIK
jgi:uncharacterized membrane protein YkvA (DUF1232 family)